MKGEGPVKRYGWKITLLLAVVLIGGGVLLLWRTGFFQAASSLEGLQAYIERCSPYSQLAFFGLQLASVIVAPIPSNLSALAGALLFGMWEAFFLTMAAVTLGSVTVFALARALGQTFVQRLVNEKVSDRYLSVLERKRDIALALVFLFPFFPDDVICILAGLTDISCPRFLFIVLLFRPWGLLFSCAVGGSAIHIPLWGMVLIGAAGLLLFLLGMTYGDRIERALVERLKRR